MYAQSISRIVYYSVCFSRKCGVHVTYSLLLGKSCPCTVGLSSLLSSSPHICTHCIIILIIQIKAEFTPVIKVKINSNLKWVNMYNVQLAVKTQLIYCTVYTRYKTTCFRLFWPSSGFSYSLETEVSYRQIYHIDDEISFTFYKLLLWREY